MSGHAPVDIPLDDEQEQILGPLRRRVQDAAEKEPGGCLCPTCGSIRNVYKETMCASIAWPIYKCLGWYLRNPDKYLQVRQHLIEVDKSDSAVHAKARHWGLIEGMPADHREPGDPPRNGMWRLTDLGSRFMRARATVPRDVFINNSVAVGFAGPEVGIRYALGKKFEYDERFAVFEPEQRKLL